MWRKSENGSLDKPLEIDKESSKKYVYVRKNFEEVPTTDQISAHWRWDETKVPKEDWEVYELAMRNAEAISGVEDALCEQDAATDERIAAIEDALCELDKAEE